MDRPVDSFYLIPLQNPSDTCWYSSRPLGYHKLGTIAACLCKSAELPGYKTNHSLQVTAATRLYDSVIVNWFDQESNDHKCGFGDRAKFGHVGVTKRTRAVQYPSTCPITDHVLIIVFATPRLAAPLYISPTSLGGPNWGSFCPNLIHPKAKLSLQAIDLTEHIVSQ